MTVGYPELVAAARARLFTPGRCACGARVQLLRAGRRQIPVTGDTPVRGWRRSALGVEGRLVTVDGLVVRVSVAGDGDLVGWQLHKCAEIR